MHHESKSRRSGSISITDTWASVCPLVGTITTSSVLVTFKLVGDGPNGCDFRSISFGVNHDDQCCGVNPSHLEGFMCNYNLKSRIFLCNLLNYLQIKNLFAYIQLHCKTTT